MYSTYSYGFNSTLNFKVRENRLFFFIKKGTQIKNELKKVTQSDWYNVNYSEKELSLVKNACGVYAIILTDTQTKKSAFAYIGSSNSLFSRLYRHPTMLFVRNTLHTSLKIDVFVYETPDYRKVEKTALNKLNPFLTTPYRESKNRIVFDEFRRSAKII